MTQLGSLSSASGLLKKVIFITCSIFSLIVVHFFRSCIKTELVTIHPSELFTSYQDLVDNKVVPVFVKTITDYLDFKFAQPGSLKKTLWDNSLLAMNASNGKHLAIHRRKIRDGK